MDNKISVEKYSFASYKEKDRTEKLEKCYIKYGKDNDFPQYLTELYLNSSTHHALCDSISYMIAGKDIEYKLPSTGIQVQKLGLNNLKGLLAFDLKVHGSFAYEIIRDNRGDIHSLEYIPMANLRPQEVDSEGDVRNYYYCEDWTDRKLVNIAKENPIPVYDSEAKENKSIVVCKTPTPDSIYFSKPDYIGSLNYIELEREISTFHVNNIKNGFFPSAIVVNKNGLPTQEERRFHMNDIESELAGAQNAGKIINYYVDNADQAPDIHAFDSNDADNMYDFLSGETTAKIMIGHRVTTPALFGVKTEGQLGNTQELETGSVLFESTVIQSMREILEKGIEIALKAAGVTEEITIPTNNPFIPNNAKKTLESTEIQSIIDVIGRVGTDLTPEQAEGILGIMGIEPETAKSFFSNDKIDELQELINQGEVLGDEWELVDSQRVEGIPIDCEKSLFTSVPSSNPNGKSEQDTSLFKVRYGYAPNSVSNDTREFCKRMIKAGKVYRYEDINAASSKPVNPGFGPGGSDTYNLWLYKGGARCHHFWERRIYMRKNNKKITVNEARKIISSLPLDERDAARIEPNDKRVAQRPTDMPNNGFLNPR